MKRRRHRWDPLDWLVVVALLVVLVGASFLLWALWPLPLWDREVASVTTTTAAPVGAMDAERERAREVQHQQILAGVIALRRDRDECRQEMATRNATPTKPLPCEPAKRLPCKPLSFDAVYRDRIAWLARHPWRQVEGSCNWTNGMQTILLHCGPAGTW